MGPPAPNAKVRWRVVLLFGPFVGLGVLLFFLGVLEPIARSLWEGPDEGLQNEALNELALWVAVTASAAAAARFTYWRARLQGLPAANAALLGLASIVSGVAIAWVLAVALLFISCGAFGRCLG